LFLMEERGYRGKYVCFETDMLKPFLKLLNIDIASRIVWVKEDVLYHFENATIVRFTSDLWRATIINRMAKSLLSSLSFEGTNDLPKRLFVKRIGIRKMLGAEEVLKKYDFKTIIPEELSVEEQIRYFYAADIVICPHGANSTNAIFMREGTSFIECFGKSYIAPCVCHASFVGNLNYRMLVESNGMDMAEDRMSYNKSNDYRIEPFYLEQAIKCALNER
ncbi:MAG: glycosyltransferase family 61 protein, partial [Lachnospiraceae bacterium]|nr:glycosyltransferase family 61 protein [Lachnospiraceae bacterium]